MTGGRGARAGYVLAGGRSTRMGRDKALLPFRGFPLAQWVAGVLREQTAAVFLLGDPERLAGLGFPVVADLYPGEGPLGGIVTALRHTKSDWNFVAACDMPGLDRSTVEALFSAAQTSGADVLLPEGPEGLPEPLCAVYHRRVVVAVEAAFSRGIRKVTAALEGVRTAGARVADVSAFQNVNTPEDWADYAGK